MPIGSPPPEDPNVEDTSHIPPQPEPDPDAEPPAEAEDMMREKSERIGTPSVTREDQ